MARARDTSLVTLLCRSSRATARQTQSMFEFVWGSCCHFLHHKRRDQRAGVKLTVAAFEIVPYSLPHYSLYSVYDTVNYIGNEQTRTRTHAEHF